MPQIRRTKEISISREQIRWKSSELIGVLNYLNENIDTWHSNHLSACAKAIEATNIKREAKPVYNKIHTLIKEYGKTEKRTSAYAVVLDNDRLRDLLDEFYNKIKEKKKKGKNQESDDDVEMTSEASTIRTDVNGLVSQQVPFSTEAVNELYREKVDQITQIQSEVIKTIKNANSTFEKSNVQIFFSPEKSKDICAKKINEITRLRSELLAIIEEINDKYEQMKSFNE